MNTYLLFCFYLWYRLNMRFFVENLEFVLQFEHTVFLCTQTVSSSSPSQCLSHGTETYVHTHSHTWFIMVHPLYTHTHTNMKSLDIRRRRFCVYALFPQIYIIYTCRQPEMSKSIFLRTQFKLYSSISTSHIKMLWTRELISERKEISWYIILCFIVHSY